MSALTRRPLANLSSSLTLSHASVQAQPVTTNTIISTTTITTTINIVANSTTHSRTSVLVLFITTAHHNRPRAR
jgi:hypothetical protein